ncbi:unnamed protein product [Orchesella dallaii]|uniref:Uncharacterized protein n=1 Tax=Orchesella dallaii TaxID=48710 RepID=A0ABP1PZ22_9HEXA
MSSASAASSSTKKVEWYHLDRVALAKRICLDNTVKLKTALNNNNNNYNSSTSISKSVKSISSGSNNVSSSSANANIISNGNKTAYDHHRSYPRPAITGKEAFAPGSNSSVVGSSHAAVDPTKGIFTLRYNTTTNLTSSTAGSASFISGSSRPSVLQQKRRRKASSRLVGVQQQQEENQCKRFLNEDGIIVNGASSDSREDSSCGSSSRSSSSGVASDFEELETGSSSNMKMSSTARTGDCQSSSSDCEEEDEEGSTLSLVEPYAPKGKVCKSSSSKNNNNNNNLSTLNSVGVVDGGNFGASGKGVMVCKGVVRIENLRTVNGKNSHKPIHNLSHGGINKIACKVESSGTSTRCKHVNGSSHSSASSTTSGSTDNDRDTDNSFSEFPPDLDFINVSDKSKRRTDRYDSSESSDSGVATLSPSTSDSPELNSTCCDFASEHLDVGNLISSSPSSSLSTSSSYPTTNSSSASSCSGSTLCLTEAQTETTTTFRTPAGVIEGAFPLSTSSDTGSLVTIPPVVVQDACCMWKGCACSNEASHNILEHIQVFRI